MEAGGEGTVWKRVDQSYEPGCRVRHWIKRKRGTEVEAFVTGFKPGNPERGHGQCVGAVEFSVRQTDGTTKPIAWVSAWSDAERVSTELGLVDANLAHGTKTVEFRRKVAR
jgi:ATP-dependent DNA ligase